MSQLQNIAGITGSIYIVKETLLKKFTTEVLGLSEDKREYVKNKALDYIRFKRNATGKIYTFWAGHSGDAYSAFDENREFTDLSQWDNRIEITIL